MRSVRFIPQGGDVLRVGTRDSELALRQTDIFVDALMSLHPDCEIEIKSMRSSGDLDLKSPLDKLQGFGAFVRELDAALLDGSIDVAVNSMKDMPIDIPEGLCVPAVLSRAEVADVSLPKALKDLPDGSVVGTSSIRRASMIKDMYPGLKTAVLRGNVRTRMAKLDAGDYDTIVLAKAGLDRLGVDREMHVMDPGIFVPAPAQGAIAIVCRSDDKDTIELLKGLNDPVTRAEVDAERHLMKLMGAGCSSPIGINAKVRDGIIQINAVSYDTGKRTEFKGRMPVSSNHYILDDAVRMLKGDTRGHVYLVGAGPGDLGLMTVKGLELLKSADVIVYDALADHSLLDLNPYAEKINAGKRSSNHIMKQDDTNSLLAENGRKGKIVVRLKGGDPFLFGRGAEEAAVLREADVPVSVVPGVSSSIAVPELAGVPVTHRNRSSMVTILTGHGKAGTEGVDWVNAAGIPGTLVILMGMDNAAEISEGLIKGGRPKDQPVSVTTDGARPEQRTETTTLEGLPRTIKDKGLKAPGIIVIGDVVMERSILGDMI